MTDILTDWMDRYRRAWETNNTNDIRALFSEDAQYRTEPYAEPWIGHAEIVDGWLAIQDEPGEFSFEWEPVVATGEMGIIQGRTVYGERDEHYRNLWVIRFQPDGRASEFTEWWMSEDEDDDEDDVDSADTDSGQA
jgi:hypothetical protein